MLRRPVVPLLVESLVPVVVVLAVPLVAVGVLASRAGEELSLPLIGALFVAAAILSLVWVGRECVVLTPSGIRIVRRLGSTDVAWWQVRAMEVRRSFGQGFLHLATLDGEALVFAPNTGVWIFKDAGFDEKVATIASWWEAYRGAGSPFR